MANGWKCPKCGGINPMNRSNCLGCNTSKPSLSNLESANKSENIKVEQGELSSWKCPKCGGINPKNKDKCLGCNTINPIIDKMKQQNGTSRIIQENYRIDTVTPEISSQSPSSGQISPETEKTIQNSCTIVEAKEILGEKNVFGQDEWFKYFQAMGINLGSTQDEIRNAGAIPWSREKIGNSGVNQPLFLFLGVKDINGEPLNINKWNSLLNKGQNPQFYRPPTGTALSNTLTSTNKNFNLQIFTYFKSEFSQVPCELRWYLTTASVLAGSVKRSYDQQVAMLPDGYEVPSAIERVTANFLYYLLNEKYLDGKNDWGRTRDLCDKTAFGSVKGDHVIVGPAWNGNYGGLFLDNDGGRPDNTIGVTASLKLL